MYIFPEKDSRIVNFFRVWNAILQAGTRRELQEATSRVRGLNGSLASSPYAPLEKSLLYYLNISTQLKDHIDYGTPSPHSVNPYMLLDTNSHEIRSIESLILFSYAAMIVPEGDIPPKNEDWLPALQSIMALTRQKCETTPLSLLLADREPKNEVEEWVLSFTHILIDKLLKIRAHKIEECLKIPEIIHPNSLPEIQACMRQRKRDGLLRLDAIISQLNLSRYPTLRRYYHEQNASIQKQFGEQVEARLSVLSFYRTSDQPQRLAARLQRLFNLYETFQTWRLTGAKNDFLEASTQSEITYQCRLLKTDIGLCAESSQFDFYRILYDTLETFSQKNQKKTTVTIEPKGSEPEATAALLSQLRALTEDHYYPPNSVNPHQEHDDQIREFFEWLNQCLRIANDEEACAIEKEVAQWDQRRYVHSYPLFQETLKAVISWRRSHFTLNDAKLQKRTDEFRKKLKKEVYPTHVVQQLLSFYLHAVARTLSIRPKKDLAPTPSRAKRIRNFVMFLDQTTFHIEAFMMLPRSAKTISHELFTELGFGIMSFVKDRHPKTRVEKCVHELNEFNVNFLLRCQKESLFDLSCDTKSPELRFSLYAAEACLRQMNLSKRSELRAAFQQRDTLIQVQVQEGHPLPNCLMSVRLPSQDQHYLDRFERITRFILAIQCEEYLSNDTATIINLRTCAAYFMESLYYDLVLYEANHRIDPNSSTIDLAFLKLTGTLTYTNAAKLKLGFGKSPPPVTAFLATRDVPDAIVLNMAWFTYQYLELLEPSKQRAWVTTEIQSLIRHLTSNDTPQRNRDNLLTILWELFVGFAWLSSQIQKPLEAEVKIWIEKSPDRALLEVIMDYCHKAFLIKRKFQAFDHKVLNALGKPYYQKCIEAATLYLSSKKVSWTVSQIALSLFSHVAKLNSDDSSLKELLDRILQDRQQIIGESLNYFQLFQHYPLSVSVEAKPKTRIRPFFVETKPRKVKPVIKVESQKPQRTEVSETRVSILDPFEKVLSHHGDVVSSLRFYYRYIHTHKMMFALPALIGIVKCIPHLQGKVQARAIELVLARSGYLFSHGVHTINLDRMNEYQTTFNAWYQPWREKIEAQQIASQPLPVEECDDSEESFEISCEEFTEDDTASSNESTEPALLVTVAKPVKFIPFAQCKSNIRLEFDFSMSEKAILDFVKTHSRYRLLGGGAVADTYFRCKPNDFDLIVFGDLESVYRQLEKCQETLGIEKLHSKHILQKRKNIRKRAKPIITIYPAGARKIDLYFLPFRHDDDLFLQILTQSRVHGSAQVYYDPEQDCILFPSKQSRDFLKMQVIDTGSECGIDLNAVITQRPEFIIDEFFKLSHYQMFDPRFHFGPTLLDAIQEHKSKLARENLVKPLSTIWFDKLLVRGHSLQAIRNLMTHQVFHMVFPRAAPVLTPLHQKRLYEFDLGLLSSNLATPKALAEARATILRLIYSETLQLALSEDGSVIDLTGFYKLINVIVSKCSFFIEDEVMNYLQDQCWNEFGASLLNARMGQLLFN